jgi:hypothetical protein
VKGSPEKKARDGISDLRKNLSAREGKYIRNMNRYMNNGVRREDLWTPYVWPQAYVMPAQNTDGVQTQFNIIKSCIDTLTSKISQSAVRPYFNALNGDYDTDCACKTLQQHFDFWLDEQHAYPKSILCFRDSATFDVGVMQIEAETQGIDRVPPWEYFLDPAEYMHNSITHIMRWRKHFPLAKLVKEIDNRELKKLLADDPRIQDEYAEYYDLYNGYKWKFFGIHKVQEELKLDYEQYGGLYRRPFIEIYYTKPLKGFFSAGLADDLYPIQRQIDELVRRFDNATRNMPLALAFVPKGSGLKASQLNNAVTAYDVLTGAENGEVKFVTPSPLSQEWIQLLKMYIDKAYELSGISQMSAESKKPADVESGKALETLEDVESDRFNVQLQQFTHFLVDLTRVCIDVFPKDKTILPAKILRDKVTWGDARKDRDKYSIQFSAASVLSKDPDKKMDQVQQMINAGFIDKSMGSHFLQIPDLEGVFTLAGSGYDAVQRIVKECIENDSTEFWETVPLELLESEIVKKVNQFVSVGDDEKYITRLTTLLDKVYKQRQFVTKITAKPPTQLPPEPIKNQAMDSGQVTGMLTIIKELNAGSINLLQAGAILKEAYPNMPSESVMSMVKPTPGGLPQAGNPAASPLGGMSTQAPAPAPVGNPKTGATNNA